MSYLFLLPVALLGLLLPADVHAQAWCAYVPCGIGGGASGVNDYLLSLGIKMVTMMSGLVAGYVLITAFTMITQSASDGQATGKKSLLSIVMGCIVVALAGTIVGAFGLGYDNTSDLAAELTKIITFFRSVLYMALIINIVLQGYRYITSQGESGQTDKARGRLFASFIGTGIVILTDVIITVARGDSSAAIPEVVGIANYLITIFGALCVIAIFAAGILYVISIDEGLKDKAKAAIKVSLICLVVVIFSAAIIRFFYTAAISG